MNTEFSFIKQDVISLLGGVPKAASFFDCSKQAIYQWPDDADISKARQYELVAKLNRPDLFGVQLPVAA